MVGIVTPKDKKAPPAIPRWVVFNLKKQLNHTGCTAYEESMNKLKRKQVKHINGAVLGRG
jgi:hypothetical protein